MSNELAKKKVLQRWPEAHMKVEGWVWSHPAGTPGDIYLGDDWIEAAKHPTVVADGPATTSLLGELNWEGIAGAIIDTVHLTNEDYVNEKLVSQLKRYFGGKL